MLICVKLCVLFPERRPRLTRTASPVHHRVMHLVLHTSERVRVIYTTNNLRYPQRGRSIVRRLSRAADGRQGLLQFYEAPITAIVRNAGIGLRPTPFPPRLHHCSARGKVSWHVPGLCHPSSTFTNPATFYKPGTIHAQALSPL